MVDQLDFDSLRRRGVAMAQAASRHLWSDYNVHDPGVAILEQYCYALTELSHRAGHPAVDLLATENGRLALEPLGLHEPSRALAIRPVTASDLADYLTGACDRAARVFVYPCRGRDQAPGEASAWSGLYDIYVVPSEDASPDDARAQVREEYHRQRNLCEDIHLLETAKPIPCRLDIGVEAPRRAAPERVAALVRQCCEAFLDGSMEAAGGAPLTRAEALDAPALMFGGSLAAQNSEEAAPPSAELLFSMLSCLPDVSRVTNVSITRVQGGSGEETDALARRPDRGAYLSLGSIRSESDVGVTVSRGGVPAPFDMVALDRELRRARSDARARSGRRMEDREWRTPPTGKRRGFDYRRVGDGFPPNFGVGRDLPPHGAPPAERNGAMQLRAYLAFSDAPVADATQDLANLPKLFAADGGSGHSYETALLDFGETENLCSRLQQADALHDDWLDPWRDRKGRVLDYLLALYGEAFSQNSLRLYDVYGHGVGRNDRVLRNRVRLIREIAELNRDRSAAANVAVAEPSTVVGMGRKLRILLDFPDHTSGGFASALVAQGLKLTDAPPEGSLLWRDRKPLGEDFDPMAAFVPPQPVSDPNIRGLFEATTFLRSGFLTGAIFRHGALIEHYAVVEASEGKVDVLLDVDDAKRVIVCAEDLDRSSAVDYVNRLCGFVADLNRDCEGVEIVEDVLLRGADGEFDPLSIHVVLPAWSARSAMMGFQRLAMETVSILRPAHLRMRCLWLDPSQSAEFHEKHLAWRCAFRDATARGQPDRSLTQAGQSLRKFLQGVPSGVLGTDR